MDLRDVFAANLRGGVAEAAAEAWKALSMPATLVMRGNKEYRNGRSGCRDRLQTN